MNVSEAVRADGIAEGIAEQIGLVSDIPVLDFPMDFSHVAKLKFNNDHTAPGSLKRPTSAEWFFL